VKSEWKSSEAKEKQGSLTAAWRHVPDDRDGLCIPTYYSRRLPCVQFFFLSFILHHRWRADGSPDWSLNETANFPPHGGSSRASIRAAGHPRSRISLGIASSHQTVDESPTSPDKLLPRPCVLSYFFLPFPLFFASRLSSSDQVTCAALRQSFVEIYYVHTLSSTYSFIFLPYFLPIVLL
jgi:hypothetical protein